MLPDVNYVRLLNQSGFFASDGPWLYVLSGLESDMKRTEREIFNNRRVLYRSLYGEKCRTKFDMFKEFAIALEFPDYFGNNWDAFDECISDLDWLPACCYVVCIYYSAVFLERDDDFFVFIKMIRSAAAEWATSVDTEFGHPSIPFRLVFQCDPSDVSTLLARLEQVNVHPPVLVVPTNRDENKKI